MLNDEHVATRVKRDAFCIPSVSIDVCWQNNSDDVFIKQYLKVQLVYLSMRYLFDVEFLGITWMSGIYPVEASNKYVLWSVGYFTSNNDDVYPVTC